MAINITGDAAADKVLSEDPFALVTGMLLDQQFPMEQAFLGPAKILDRFGNLDPALIARADPEEFAAMCASTPAVHRFPGSMAARIQALASLVLEKYDGQTARIWEEAPDGKALFKRIQELPGFGKQKTQILVSLLAKQLDVRPDGWEAVAGNYALPGRRSVADVVDPASLQEVRDHKKQMKAAAKAK